MDGATTKLSPSSLFDLDTPKAEAWTAPEIRECVQESKGVGALEAAADPSTTPLRTHASRPADVEQHRGSGKEGPIHTAGTISSTVVALASTKGLHNLCSA